MIHIALTVMSACLQEVQPHMDERYADTLRNILLITAGVSFHFAVAMMTAAHRDVVLNIEESPIVKAKVMHSCTMRETLFLLLHLLIDKYSLFYSYHVGSR